MENLSDKMPENHKPSFFEKYGMLIFVIGIIASIFILNFLLHLIQ